MANEIQTKDLTAGTFTITLASLANGAGRQASEVSNTSNYPAAKIGVKITTGTGPTNGSIITVWLLEKAGTIRSDGHGTLDDTIILKNSNKLGTIVVDGTSDKTYQAVFDTYRITDCLGETLCIAILNETGVALNATAANHAVEYFFYVPEIQ